MSQYFYSVFGNRYPDLIEHVWLTNILKAHDSRKVKFSSTKSVLTMYS